MVEVLFVGTGDAYNSGGRRNSAILIRDGKRTLLLDCGPTTLLGLQDLGIDPRDIDALAISHFHGDHASGIPFLLLAYLYEHPRARPLEILGPPGVEEFIDTTSTRFSFTDPDKQAYELTYREFEAGSKIETVGFTLLPLPAVHQPETRPHMLRIDTGRRTLFFSGDTGWHDEYPRHAGDVDLCISECTLMEEGFEYHIAHERLVRERRRFDARRIVLTHLGRQVLENIDDVQFDVAHDGLKLEI